MSDTPEISELVRLTQENARLSRELAEALRSGDNFIEMASHDLKNPLTSLKLKLSGLIRLATKSPDGIPGQHVKNKLERASHQIDHMVMTLNSLSDFSRIAAGKLDLRPEELDLSVLAEDMVTRLSEPAQQAGCAIHLLAATPVLGYWDKERLEQIVSDLISSALCIGAGQPIQIAVNQTGGQARLTMRDHGVEVDPERLTLTFEQARGPAAMMIPGEGSWPRLWLVGRLVDRMGGRIKAEGKLGEGTTFVLDLPRNLDRPPPPKSALRHP